MNRWMRWGTGAGIVAAMVLVTLWKPSPGGVEHLQMMLQSYGKWSIVVSAALMIGQAIIAPIPGNVITITNGLVFGPFWGGVLSWITILIGASLCFGLSRVVGRPFAVRIAGATFERAEHFFQRYGLQAVFAVRIMPLVPFDAISYAAGLVGVSYYKFIIATAVGIIPSVIVYSYLGSIAVSAYSWILFIMLGLALAGVVLLPRLILLKTKFCAAISAELPSPITATPFPAPEAE